MTTLSPKARRFIDAAMERTDDASARSIWNALDRDVGGPLPDAAARAIRRPYGLPPLHYRWSQPPPLGAPLRPPSSGQATTTTRGSCGGRPRGRESDCSW